MSAAKEPVSPGFETWRVEGHPICIEYTPALMDDLRSAAVENFLSIPRSGIEIGGVLLGRRQGSRVQLLKQRRIACEYATGPSFVLSARDEAALAQMLEKYQRDPEMDGLEPAGWYVSHTRGEIRLSEHDLEIYSRYFPEPLQVALVLKPAKIGPTRAGFFFREADGSVRAEAPYRELALFSAPQVRRSAASAGDGGPILEQVYVEKAQKAPDDAPPVLAPASQPKVEKERWYEAAGTTVRYPKRRIAISVAAVLLCALFAAAFGSGKLWTVDSGEYDLGLKLSSSGDRLLVEWDRSAEAVRAAYAGSVSIADGGSNSETVPLDSGRLRHGNVNYVRRTGNVEVRLKIFRTGEPPVEEMVQFVGPPISTAGAESAAPPRSAPSELEKDAERMREELRRLNAEMSRLQSPARDSSMEIQSRAALRMQQTRAESAPSAPGPKPRPRLIELPAVPAESPAVVPSQTAIPKPPVLGYDVGSIGSVPPSVDSRAAETVKAQAAAGRAIWTGALPKNGLLSLDGKFASAGSLTGQWPHGPIRIVARPAELVNGGMVVYMSTPAKDGRKSFSESPGAQNGWNLTVYRWDPKRARDITVLETPNVQNGWNRLIIRNGERALSVIVLDWETVSAAGN